MIRTSSAIKILGKDGIWHRILTIKGDKGEQGERGETGAAGRDGRDGIDGRDGRDGINPVYITNSKDDIPTDPDKSIMIVTEAEGEDVLGKISESIEANADAIEKQQQLMPTNEPTVGKLARVEEVFPDGTFRMEWVDAQTGGVSDVTVNGASVVTDGVAAVPIGGTGKAGVYKVGSAYGTYASGEYITTSPATEDRIDVRNNGATVSTYAPVCLSRLDYAVRASLTDNNNKLTYSAEQQQAACERLGAEREHSAVTLVNSIIIDSDNYDLAVSASDSGQPYDFKFMYIDMQCELAQQSWKEWILSSRAGSTAGAYRIGRVYSYATKWVRITIEQTHGIWRMFVYAIDSEGKTTSVPYSSIFMADDITDAIRFVSLKGLNKDTKVMIYAA